MHLQDVDELYQAGWRPAKETAPWGQSLPVAPQPAASTASAPPKKVACKSHPATSPLLPLLNPSQQPTNLPVPIDRLVPSAVRRHPFSNARTKEVLLMWSAMVHHLSGRMALVVQDVLFQGRKLLIRFHRELLQPTLHLLVKETKVCPKQR